MAGAVGSSGQEAQTRLEIGRRLGDRVELERAATMLAEIGAALDLAEARQLLSGPAGEVEEPAAGEAPSGRAEAGVEEAAPP